jgi:hypothetical protein
MNTNANALDRVLTLEALQAGKGDCLLLHYGPAGAPRLVVIDGGPRTIFAGALQPRLDQLRTSRAAEERLSIDLMMVSHIDDDHIQGVLDLTRYLVERMDKQEFVPYAADAVWYNSFDDVLANGAEEIFSRLASNPAVARPAAAVLASVANGRALRADLERLKWNLNYGFEGLVMAPPEGKAAVALPGGLTLSVLSPPKRRVEALHKEWEEFLEDLEKRRQASPAAYDDRSAFNLSSIVVLAEYGGRSVLLTGDARGDDIARGFKAAGLLSGGRCHIDVFKLPHHGSSRNVRLDLFQQITADHYVISANGENGNPDVETLEMIAEARGADEYLIHLTNRDGKKDLGAKLDQLFRRRPDVQRRTRFRGDKELSIKVDLLSPVHD